MRRNWTDDLRKVGYKLPLLVTMSGAILDFHLAPANASDLSVDIDLSSEYTDLSVLGKAYVSAAEAAELWRRRIRLTMLPRRNQKRQAPSAAARWINAGRPIIETVDGQLIEQLHVNIYHVHTLWDLCARHSGVCARAC